MISEQAIRIAIQQGIISSSQSDALKSIEASLVKKGDLQTPDYEKIRFISGFGDIFVFIGIMLFLGASGYFLIDVHPNYIVWLVLSALYWFLAEIFSRRQRMAFPSIILLICFVIFAFLGINTLLNYFFGYSTAAGIIDVVSISLKNPGRLAIAALITCGLAALHYLRFKVPITIAAATAAFAGSAYGFLLAVAPELMRSLGFWPFLLIGFLVFALAMRFDASDLTRQTRRTDVAFWLHLLAAPLVVHSLIAILFGRVNAITLSTAFVILCIFLGLAIIAVLIDRRAILVSGLAYAGIAFGTLLKQTALSTAIIPATLLALGLFILVLSIGWSPLRSLMMRQMPELIRSRLPSSSPAGIK